ncbi:MAG: adenosine kinase [Alphaproteobacteria bacterium]|nr:adenosine kinase [Alphaproteobacteria bacterium]
MNALTRFDVVAIGNAMVDVLANMDDEFLAKHNMPKGMMTLIDAPAAEMIYSHIAQNGVECSGGSAANTAVGIAALGGRPAFIGKVADDQLGEIFRKDITRSGVYFTTPCLENERPTARCMVIVSPDAQRTMNTYLGACSKLSRKDIDEDLIRQTKIVYMEGYLWDRPEAKDALAYAVELAHKYDRKVSLSLSDPYCVNRHRDSFLQLIKNGVDILFCNEDEIKALFDTDDPEEAFKHSENLCEIVVVTRGAKGAIAICGQDRYEIPAAPINRVIDTTGAGDLFAAGFLTGFSHGRSVFECLQMGALAAAEIISHYGARPETSLSELIAKKVG